MSQNRASLWYLTTPEYPSILELPEDIHYIHVGKISASWHIFIESRRCTFGRIKKLYPTHILTRLTLPTTNRDELRNLCNINTTEIPQEWGEWRTDRKPRPPPAKPKPPPIIKAPLTPIKRKYVYELDWEQKTRKYLNRAIELYDPRITRAQKSKLLRSLISQQRKEYKGRLWEECQQYPDACDLCNTVSYTLLTKGKALAKGTGEGNRDILQTPNILAIGNKSIKGESIWV